MIEVDASRFVRARPAEIERVLTPRTVIEYEGSFEVRESRATDDGGIVTAAGGGMELTFAFESVENGFRYEQRSGPLERLTTTLTYRPKDEGSEVTMRSVVATGTPPSAVTDRVAAWKRRGELRRALSRLAADVE